VRRIAINAGEDGSIIVGRLVAEENYGFGYNAVTGEYQDLITAGIIDPVKVVRTALEDAASIASLLITTEAMIADRSTPESPLFPAG
jgi:chaperonin GroEL